MFMMMYMSVVAVLSKMMLLGSYQALLYSSVIFGSAAYQEPSGTL